MTPEETIETAIHCLGVRAEQEVCEECPAYLEGGIACREVARAAISALEELQQYREIGTVEECREAMVKQIPKKPYHEEWIGIDGKPYDLCPNPNCMKNIYTTSSKISYCEHCGQAITWDKSSDTVGNKN